MAGEVSAGTVHESATAPDSLCQTVADLRDGTALPEGNLFFQLVLPVWCRWEWSLRVGFDCRERAPLPIDYAWLVEQIELRTGRAKPLPPKAEHPSSPLTIARAFDGGRSTLDISLVSWGKP